MLSGQQTTNADAAVTKRVKKVREIHVYCTIIKISTENPHSVYHGKLRWGGKQGAKEKLRLALPLFLSASHSNEKEHLHLAHSNEKEHLSLTRRRSQALDLSELNSESLRDRNLRGVQFL